MTVDQVIASKRQQRLQFVQWFEILCLVFGANDNDSVVLLMTYTPRRAICPTRCTRSNTHIARRFEEKHVVASFLLCDAVQIETERVSWSVDMECIVDRHATQHMFERPATTTAAAVL